LPTNHMLYAMTKKRTEMETAAGKLISAIQKEWGNELGESVSIESEEIMNKGHDLLKAAKENEIEKMLSGRGVADYIGRSWVEKHRSVLPAIQALEETMTHESV
jgi:hypothetical protein